MGGRTMDAMMDGMVGGMMGELPGAGELRDGAVPGGPADACGLEGARPVGDAVPGGGMIVAIGGQYFDLGSGTADTDGDGVADSVTLADDRGLSIYSDIDGDGAVDHVTTVLFDGTYETWIADASQSQDGDRNPGAAGDHGPPPAATAAIPGSEEIGNTSFGGGSRGELAADDLPAGVPSAWGVHEWERGEKGRWA